MLTLKSALTKFQKTFFVQSGKIPVEEYVKVVDFLTESITQLMKEMPVGERQELKQHIDKVLNS